MLLPAVKENLQDETLGKTWDVIWLIISYLLFGIFYLVTWLFFCGSFVGFIFFTKGFGKQYHMSLRDLSISFY